MTPLQTATIKLRNNALSSGIRMCMFVQLTPQEVVALRKKYGDPFIRTPNYADVEAMLSNGQSVTIHCTVFPKLASTPFVFTKPRKDVGGTK